MATAAEFSGCAFETKPGGAIRWNCPLCGRAMKIGVSQSTNSDRGGWHGTLGPRWPRHYSWAEGMK